MRYLFTGLLVDKVGNAVPPQAFTTVFRLHLYLSDFMLDYPRHDVRPIKPRFKRIAILCQDQIPALKGFGLLVQIGHCGQYRVILVRLIVRLILVVAYQRRVMVGFFELIENGAGFI